MPELVVAGRTRVRDIRRFWHDVQAPPSLLNLPTGCAFRPRCPHEFSKCVEVPGLEARLSADPNHRDRCWLTPEQKKTLREVEPGRIGLEEPR